MVIGADRRLAYQLGYSSRWTLLSTLMRRFHAALIDDEKRVERLQGLFTQLVATFIEVEPFSRFSDDLKRNAADLGASLEYGLERPRWVVAGQRAASPPAAERQKQYPGG